MRRMSKVINLKIKNNLLNLDASEIATLIKERRITITEVTNTLIKHIKHVNLRLNAVVEDRFEKALEEAKIKDEQINQVNFSLKPLYGVPISIKESFDVIGMKTT